MALSQEEILQLRQEYGFDKPSSATPTAGGGMTAQQRINSLWPAPKPPPAPEHFKTDGFLGTIQDVAHGAAKSGTKTILDVGHLGQKIQGVVGGGLDALTGDKYDFSGDAKEGVFAPESAEGQQIREEVQPVNTAEKVGGAIEKVAEFAVPIGGAPAATVLGKAAQGAAIGGGMGGVQAIADDKSAGEVALDAGIGAAAGGALGLAGGAVSKFTRSLSPEEKLKFVTPTSREIPEAEYKNLVKQGRITPRTLTKPAEYIMSPSEKEVAIKYHDVLEKNPVNTTINIQNKIGELDDEVGNFLRSNNGIFNRGELRNHLTEALDDLDDITIPEDRVQKAKENIIDRFTENIEKGDMEGLWQARKDFDKSIEKAFKGSPTLQKEVKIKLRNAVQDFIADRTPDGKYRALMKDMSNLFDLQDVATVKAAKGRGLDELRQWVKDNPKTAKVLGLTAAFLTGAGLISGGATVVNAGGSGN